MKTILALLFFCIFLGCSKTPSEHEPEATIAGVYFMHGEQINIRYDFPWPSFGGKEVVLERDTMKISFTIEIEIEEDRLDTLKFMGLPMASSSYRDSECRFVSPDCAFAKKTDKNFDFNLKSPSGDYTGIGTLENGRITLDTHFEYRAIGIDYSLQGERVDP